MSVTFADPRWLWLLAVVPLVAGVAFLTRSTFGSRQRWLQGAVRSIVLALLAAALAQPIVAVSRPRTAVIYLVDVSHSIASRAIDQAAERIDALNAALKPDRVRIFTFGVDTEPVPDTRALRSLANGQTRTSAARAGQTDIERALDDARAELRPGESPRVVLFSDGRETRGDAQTAAMALAAEGVPVFVEPMDVKDLGDAWIDALRGPATWPAVASVNASVDVWSQRAVPVAVIELHDGARLVGSARAALRTGLTTIEVATTIATPGSHVLSASLNAPDDPLRVNNELSREILVQPPTRVLYIDGSPERGGVLEHALTQAGLVVTTRGPSALPTGPASFNAWDAIIVSDVARAAIPDATMRSLARFVEEEGGGLLFAGGDQVFGAGRDAPTGYHGTEIERLLPVTIERKDEPDIALVMVLDKSWSMAGPVMELCKSAAQAAVDALDDRQAVGVLSFDDRFQWDVTPRPVGPNRDAIRRAIAAIQPGGDTLIFPALEQAYLQLRQFHANAKHVVLLSDGRSYPDDYEGLVKRMVGAGMTVSSIAVGREADAQLLGRIATWGKGRAYAVLNAAEVPKIFVKEAKTAMPAFDEGEGVVPVVKTRSVLSSVALHGIPPLRGRTAMVLKDTATEILATPNKGEPVLAWWPIGRGRTAAFASDVKNRWGRDWVGWSGYGPLFATLVRSIARQVPHPLTLDLRHTAVDADRQALHIGVESRDPEGNYRNLFRPSVRLQSSAGREVVVPAHQVAPGRYEATVIAGTREPLIVEASQPGFPAAVARRIVPDPDEEYRLRPPNDMRLKAIAEATGGAYRPVLDTIRRAAGHAQPERRALWPWLVLAAALLWPVDILLRRVRLFEIVTELT